MKLTLIDNQVDLIMKSLQEYSKKSEEKNLIFMTYESILEQKNFSKATESNFACRNKNVI